jgi:hypothetical protein
VLEAVIGSSGLAPAGTDVRRRTSGDLVTVVVAFRDPTDVPLVGDLLPDITLTASATMRREAVDPHGAWPRRIDAVR